MTAFALAALGLAGPLAAQQDVTFDPVAPPTTGGFDVFVEQIGTGNSATINQATNSQTTEVKQEGDDNVAEVDQEDAGAHAAVLDQEGNRNSALVTQGGNGQVALLLNQDGNDNSAVIGQTDNGAIGSFATVFQEGSDNLLNLTQDGSDNQARLVQEGDNNAMTAVQNNTGNRLEWVQQGSNLSDLSITQSGGQQMLILQTNGVPGGAGN